MKIAIFGLGYVGLPLACLSAKRGHEVIGVDINEKVVELINNGISHIKDHFLEEEIKKVNIEATTEGVTAVKHSDIIIICVPTPVDKNHRPNLDALINAVKTVSKGLKKGSLVIVESTISPYTCREIVKPILEESGLKAEKDFYLVHCPERIDPGNKKWPLEKLPRVIGGLSDNGRKKAVEFYKSIIDAEINELSSIEAAEAVKIVENTFRDVNIAFVNELAQCFDKLGIDIIEVIRGAATKPFAFMPHYPGCGVGGHCISVDPYYLIEGARSKGFDHKFLRLAREINSGMPEFTVKKIMEALNEVGKSVKGTKISILGLAYKPNVDDIRESPSLIIIEKLKQLGADLEIYDPYILAQSTVKTLEDALKSECLVIATAHKEFLEISYEELKKNGIKVVVDGRNCLDKEKIKSLGIVYKGIGR